MSTPNPTPVRASDFRTPVHKLIPKLLKSRDTWKAKADRRQHLLHSQRIRIRDLSASRQRWKEQALAAQSQLQLAQDQLTLLNAQLTQLKSTHSPQN
jgi:hypothetical protein